MGRWGRSKPKGQPAEEGADQQGKRRFRWTIGRIIALSLAGAAVLALTFAGLH